MKKISGKNAWVDSAREANRISEQRRKLSRAIVEALEGRTLLTVSVTISDSQVNTEGNDTSSNFRQFETSNVVYTPVGSTSPDVVVSYTDSTAALLNGANNDFYGNVSYSNNGGSSFTTPATHLPSPANTDPVAANAAHMGDNGNLDLARDDATGYVYAVCRSDPSALQQVIQLYQSTNNGSSFSYDGTVTPQPDNSQWNSSTIKQFDRPWLAIDNFNLSTSAYRYIATYVEDNNIYVTRTTNMSSWPAPSSDGPVGTLLASSSGVDFANHAEVVIGHNTSGTDYVYVVWAEMDADSSNPVGGEDLKYDVRYSTDYTTASTPTWHTAASFTLTTPDADRVHDLSLKNGPTRTNVSPSIAANPVNGDLYVAYMDGNAGDPSSSSAETAPGMDIYIRRLAHGDTAFSSATDISTDTLGGGAAEDQWQPAMAVAPTGTEIFVGYYDRRNDSSNTNYQVYGAFGSVDNSSGGGGAMTWNASDEVQINPTSGSTAYSIPSRDNAYNDQSFMGDYDQASADYGYFYYSYMTTHYVSDGSYYDPEIRLAKISIPYPETTPGIPSGFLAVVGDSSATLEWGGDYSTEKVDVEYSTGTVWQDYNSTAAASDDSMTFSPSGYNNSTVYYFRIRAYTSDKEASSDWAYGRTYNDTPVITSIGAYNADAQSVPVYWDNSAYSDPAVMHVLFSVDGGSTWHDLSGNTTTATSSYGVAAGLSDYDPVDLTQVRVRIQVQYAGGTSKMSDEMGIGIPNILTVTDDGDGEYELTWASDVFTGDMYMQWKDPYGDDWSPGDESLTTIAADGWGAIDGLYADGGYTFRIGNTMGTDTIVWSSD